MTPWRHFFDPEDPMLFAMQSDLDWVRGDYVATLPHPVATASEPGNGWIMPYRSVAERMIRDDPETALALVGALFSWRTVTVDQLRAGLCNMPLPAFDRDNPNIYGALARLGVINVGFSKRERLEHIRVPQVWLAIGNDRSNVESILSLTGQRPWFRKGLTAGVMYGIRQHARHNTFAAHVSLAACHDPRVQLTGGDGWGGFRLLDAQAQAESGAHIAAATDATILTDTNVMAGIEVQVGTSKIKDKMDRWAHMLAYSPMARRGLVCIWLSTPMPHAGASNFPAIMEGVSQLPEMAAGVPPVAHRMGYATWDEWFDHGRPTGMFGEYTDVFGVRRSIFDPAWRQYTPRHVHGIDGIRDWGWRQMRSELYNAWGWDTGSWRFADKWRGGFYGFATPHDPTVMASMRDGDKQDTDRKETPGDSGDDRLGTRQA